MIFEVIKGSHSVELTVLIESRKRSSSPNSQTGLVTAAGGAQKRSAVGRRAERDMLSDFILKDAVSCLVAHAV